MRKLTYVFICLLFCAASYAASPAGLWKTVDDSTGKEKSLVRITDNGSVVSGSIEKLLDPDVKSDAVCGKCDDDRKNKPLVGLNILRGLKKSSSEDNIWENGDVLDPHNGKVYRARIKLVDGGRKLELRGYLGPFYRTQTWIKAN